MFLSFRAPIIAGHIQNLTKIIVYYYDIRVVIMPEIFLSMSRWLCHRLSNYFTRNILPPFQTSRNSYLPSSHPSVNRRVLQAIAIEPSYLLKVRQYTCEQI